MRKASLAMACLASVLAIGCTEAGVSGDLTLEDASRQLVGLVDATAEAAADGLPVQPDREVTRTAPCTDAELAETGQVAGTYGLIVELQENADGDALAERTRSYWEDQGYAVRATNMGAEQPTLYLTVEGFQYTLLVNKDQQRGYLGGTTPCVPPGS